MNDAFDAAHEKIRAINRKRSGYNGKPFASFFRDVNSFGVVMLIEDDKTNDLLVSHWLVRGVSEAEARAVLEAQA